MYPSMLPCTFGVLYEGYAFWLPGLSQLCFFVSACLGVFRWGFLVSETARMIPLLIDSKIVVFLSIVVGLGPIAPVLSSLFALLLQYVLSKAPRPPSLVSLILLLMLF